jgi:outer membrane lipoprotein-sorting protein
VKLLRTASTTRLIAFFTVLVVVLAGAAVAVAKSGGGGPVPDAKSLPEAIHDALVAPAPDGVTARISFTNNLFPSGALTGTTGSALETGAGGRLWLNSSGGRIELQSDAGDVQVVWDTSKVTLYDASSNTAYTADLPKDTSSTATTDTAGPPSLDQISTFLTDLGKHWTVSGATPTDVGGQAAYSVSVSPSHDGGLLGSAELAWDAMNGVPLKIAVYAQGSSAPALALQVDQISFGAVSDSDVAVAVPAGAKTIDLSSAAGSGSPADGSTAPITGLAAVQAAAPFPVVAPDTLVGLPLQDIRLVGATDATQSKAQSQSVLAVYGQGLGAIVVVERAKDTTAAPAGKDSSGALSALPSVSLDGVTAHELSTELGSVLTWDNGGVSYILAGSVPTAAAEAAARALK